jgi:uncharacterized membrane protein (DUF485 family)
MDKDLVRRIASHPQYQTLKARRTRLGWILTLLMLVVYYSFITLVAFNKPFFAQRLGDGVMTPRIPSCAIDAWPTCRSGSRRGPCSADGQRRAAPCA